MTSKSRKLNDAISELANTVPYGNLMLCTNPTELILSVIAHIKDIESRLAARDAMSCDTCIRDWATCRIKGSLESIRSQNGLKMDHGSFCSEWKPREEVE